MTVKARLTLSEEKKTLIIEAALSEFAEHGYKNASTNSIIKEAGVSKGLLFHYFGNKKQMFLYILDWAIDYTNKYFDNRMGELPNDIIDCIIKANIMKVEFATKEPKIQKFLFTAFLDPPKELKQELKEREQKMTEKYMPLLMGNIKTSPFREDIDTAKAVELIMIVVNSLSEKCIKLFLEKKCDDNAVLTAFVKELEIYFEILKHGVYKQYS